MATERLSMRKAREILRLVWELGHSQRETKRSLRIGLGTVCETLKRARAAGLDWLAVCQLDDAALEARLCPARESPEVVRPMPDPVYIHLERKRPGVTLELLHQEYMLCRARHYRYNAECLVMPSCRWPPAGNTGDRGLRRAFNSA